MTVKVPLTLDGLKACRTLTAEGTMVNVTLCFSANQALLAAKAGATFISPFIGRLDDIGLDGMELIREIRTDLRQLSTSAPKSSPPRSARATTSSRRRSSAPTSRPCRRRVLKSLVEHPLTDKGLEIFLADWKKTGQRSFEPILRPAKSIEGAWRAANYWEAVARQN